MILREATDDDLKPLATFITYELCALDINQEVSLSRLQKAKGRMGVLLEDNKIVAALWVIPTATDKGPGYDLVSFTVAGDHPDKVRVLDVLCLWSLNRAAYDGRSHITGLRAAGPAVAYGRDFLGMEQEVVGIDPNTRKPALYRQWGNAQAMIKCILQRRPEWSL